MSIAILIDKGNCEFDNDGNLIICGNCNIGIVSRTDCNFTLGDPPAHTRKCSSFANIKRINECTVKTKEGGTRNAWICDFEEID